MVTSETSLDYSIRPSVFDSQLEVRVLHFFISPMSTYGAGSYISEAAASLLDQRLHLYIVPRTELVSLSSSVGAGEV